MSIVKMHRAETVKHAICVKHKKHTEHVSSPTQTLIFTTTSLAYMNFLLSGPQIEPQPRHDAATFFSLVGFLVY